MADTQTVETTTAPAMEKIADKKATMPDGYKAGGRVSDSTFTAAETYVKDMQGIDDEADPTMRQQRIKAAVDTLRDKLASNDHDMSRRLAQYTPTQLWRWATDMTSS